MTKLKAVLLKTVKLLVCLIKNKEDTNTIRNNDIKTEDIIEKQS